MMISLFMTMIYYSYFFYGLYRMFHMYPYVPSRIGSVFSSRSSQQDPYWRLARLLLLHPFWDGGAVF